MSDWHSWKLTARTFGAFSRPSEWWFRIAGWGFGVRDHRRIPPLFSERYQGRYGCKRRLYIHVGPYCLTTFRRSDFAVTTARRNRSMPAAPQRTMGAPGGRLRDPRCVPEVPLGR